MPAFVGHAGGRAMADLDVDLLEDRPSFASRSS